MAITYTVTRSRESQRLTVTGDGSSYQARKPVSYTVIVTDPADSGFHGSDVDELDVYVSADLPTVNKTCYTTLSGDVEPFLVCRSLDINRSPENAAHFTAEATFAFNMSDSQQGFPLGPQTPPAALTDFTPIEEVSLIEGQRVMYRDKSDAMILTPAGNYFAEPTMERFAIRKITVKQYEASLTYDQFQERKFKINDATYRSKAAGTWLIEDVRAAEVDVELAAGTTTAVLVEYDLLYTDRTNGWKEEKVLVDTHYLEFPAVGAPRKKRWIDDDINSLGYGLVNADGSQRAIEDGPVYEAFEIYDSIDFSSFLQV